MRRGFWRYIQNIKNRMIFGHYGRNVYIFPNVNIARPQFIWIGDDVTIGKGTDIYVHPTLSDRKDYVIWIGNNVHIGSYNIIGARKGIVLEDNVMLGPHVMIGDHSHQYENVDLPVKLQEATEGEPIRIERDSWIGANVFIFPHVTIGRHSVVGANSVVNRDIPSYSVAVGAPARVIKRYDFESKQWVRWNGRGDFLE
jgi:acetyltransferase-like isoleucine patch superfamily enzyme